MDKQKIVIRYMEILFSEGDLNELNTIFSGDLKFTGPFYRFDSANAYIESLKKDPPTGFKHELIDVFEKANKVSLFYNFSKGKIETPMAQLFTFEGDLIKSILLIFNSADFT